MTLIQPDTVKTFLEQIADMPVDGDASEKLILLLETVATSTAQTATDLARERRHASLLADDIQAGFEHQLNALAQPDPVSLQHWISQLNLDHLKVLIQGLQRDGDRDQPSPGQTNRRQLKGELVGVLKQVFLERHFG